MGRGKKKTLQSVQSGSLEKSISYLRSSESITVRPSWRVFNEASRSGAKEKDANLASKLIYSGYYQKPFRQPLLGSLAVWVGADVQATCFV